MEVAVALIAVAAFGASYLARFWISWRRRQGARSLIGYAPDKSLKAFLRAGTRLG
jgi:hypothetical protein